MRLGGDNLTDADWALLESRVCSTKGHVEGCKKAAKVRCCKFEDTVKPARTKAGRKSRAAPKVTGRLYCAIATGATVIAALREKVNAINELHIEGQRQKNIRIYESQAVDTGPMGLPVINPHVLAAVDKQARSQLRTLSMYVGMSALLTINADMATEFVNGTLGRVEEIVVDESNEEIVKAIRFRPDGSKNVLTIPRRKLQIAVKGVGMISRSQFPLIPA